MATYPFIPLTADTHIPLDCCFTPIFTQLENQPTHFWEWVVTPLFEEERFVVVELEYLSHTHCMIYIAHADTYQFSLILCPLTAPHIPPLTAVFCSNQRCISEIWVVRTTVSVGEVCCGWARVPATQHNAWLTYTHATCIIPTICFQYVFVSEGSLAHLWYDKRECRPQPLDFCESSCQSYAFILRH